MDAIFTSDLGRAKEIVKYLIKLKNNYKIQLPWLYWEFNYNMIDDEFLRLVSQLKNREKILNSNEIQPINRPQHYSEMVKDYIAINSIGIQSFSKKTLKSVNRPSINKDKIGQFMNILKRYNLVLKADLILGLPYETFFSFFEGIEYFLEFFRDTDHILNIHLLEILPGSELEELCDVYKLKYAKDAPHQILSTNALTEEEIIYASKLIAILFRIINSPLRKYLFKIKDTLNSSFLNIIEEIYKEIKNNKKLQNIRLIIDKYIDDYYWNEEIFSDIPSEWLLNVFKNLMK